MKRYIIIPARLESNRLPNKPMLVVNGKPLIRWTYDRALEADSDRVLVATSDQEILNYCTDSNMGCVFTRADHPSGTHRCVEASRDLEEDSLEFEDDRNVIVNWQCDEPLVEPGNIDNLMSSVEQFYDIATLVSPIEQELLEEPNTTKAIVGHNGLAHWFTRDPIAYGVGHIGIYAFKQPTLRKLGKLRPTKLSKEESLEQLIWIEHGFSIGTVGIKKMPLSVNTQKDLGEFERILNEEND